MPSYIDSNPQPAIAFDHVGIRVTKRAIAKAFYEKLGFRETITIPHGEANEMVTDAGVRINLIFNGAKQLNNTNVLLDAPIKVPGITHPAFIVEDISALKHWLEHQEIQITEGPKQLGPRRVALFIRDPDGNVLEFNQLFEQDIK
ncbi:VOC family protein [Pseudoalteromonas haloplanktis]|uniref:VOC family protein n=1 Tax=Pseudoalteromonas haloplanktis TaxID=228 RepID=A0ABU1B729_PSEHA|nr:VOC family protein [Pseudoalteromonas haloplanktis]MDQ9090363.1 VOC family protein [Pseudoalteromonas haloplanktis]